MSVMRRPYRLKIRRAMMCELCNASFLTVEAFRTHAVECLVSHTLDVITVHKEYDVSMLEEIARLGDEARRLREDLLRAKTALATE